MSTTVNCMRVCGGKEDRVGMKTSQKCRTKRYLGILIVLPAAFLLGTALQELWAQFSMAPVNEKDVFETGMQNDACNIHEPIDVKSRTTMRSAKPK